MKPVVSRFREIDGDARNKVHIVAEPHNGRRIKFGSMLTNERRRYLAAAADRVLKGGKQAGRLVRCLVELLFR